MSLHAQPMLRRLRLPVACATAFMLTASAVVELGRPDPAPAAPAAPACFDLFTGRASECPLPGPVSSFFPAGRHVVD